MTPSPAEVLQQLLSGIASRSWSELHRLYAEDAVVEYPFGLPTPSRLAGREAIAAYFTAVAKAPLSLIARDIVIRTTDDPEVVVVEWTYDGEVTTTGRRFEAPNIQVSRVRDGLILESRDYHNHLLLAAVAGRLDRLMAAFSDAVLPTPDAPR